VLVYLLNNNLGYIISKPKHKINHGSHSAVMLYSRCRGFFVIEKNMVYLMDVLSLNLIKINCLVIYFFIIITVEWINFYGCTIKLEQCK